MASSQSGHGTAAAHHDAARAAVPSTAIAVCSLRALEARKPEGQRLVYDRFAEILCGQEALSSESAAFWEKTGRSVDFWVDFLATRTKWIDDEVGAVARMQVVILGSGLDSRAWRLEALKGQPLFEIDFQEIIDAKASLLAAETPLASRTALWADLGADDWTQQLSAAGFVPTVPTVWVLEGLTGYLTEEELIKLFRGLTTASALGSRLVASFVGDGMRAQTTSMHRFHVADAEHVRNFLADNGWRGAEVFSMHELASGYGRAQHIEKDYAYWLARVTLPVPQSDL